MIDKNSEKYKTLVAIGYSEEAIDAAYEYAEKSVALGGNNEGDDEYNDSLIYVVALAFLGGYKHAKDKIIKRIGL